MPPPVTLEPRFRYNPDMASLPSIGPSIPPLLLLLFPAILMAVSVAREKEIGTITNFYVTPTGRAEFLIGKQLVYIGIGLLNFAILTALVVLVLGVPLHGNPLVLVLATVVYVVAATGFGLMVSMMTSFVTSYARARAESVGFEVKNGIATRADRLVIILVGMAITGLTHHGLWLAIDMVLLAVLGVATVFQRVLEARRQMAAGHRTYQL